MCSKRFEKIIFDKIFQHVIVNKYLSSFCLNWPRMGFDNPIYKNELFFSTKLTFHYHLNKIYMAFYLLTLAYFNDVNGGKNLNLKESFL